MSDNKPSAAKQEYDKAKASLDVRTACFASFTELEGAYKRLAAAAQSYVRELEGRVGRQKSTDVTLEQAALACEAIGRQYDPDNNQEAALAGECFGCATAIRLLKGGGHPDPDDGVCVADNGVKDEPSVQGKRQPGKREFAGRRAEVVREQKQISLFEAQELVETDEWQPTPEELERLNAGASIHLTVLGTVHPPVSMTVGAPPTKYQFEENECPGHVASKANPKICAHCGTHVDSLRPDEDA